MARLYRLADAVVLRRERFGGMAFHTRRGTTIELDVEGFEFLRDFACTNPFPEADSTAYTLAFELRRQGFLQCGGAFENKSLPVADTLPQIDEPDVLSAPEVVHIALTAHCDLSCPGCYAAVDGAALSWPALRELIEQLAEMRVFQIALGGGEPTLYPHLIDAVAYARRLKIVPNMTTHGGHLTPALIAALREAGIGQINVSLNASVPEYNTGRDARAWQVAVNGLEQLRGDRVATGVNCLVTKRNLQDLPSLFSYLVEMRVRHVTILGPKPANDPAWLLAHQLDAGNYVQLQQMLNKWSSRLNITVDCALVDLLMSGLPKTVLQRRAVYGCAAARRICVVDANGDVWLCAFQQSPRFCAGNIQEAQLQTLWLHSAGFKRFRQEFQDKDKMKCKGDLQ